MAGLPRVVFLGSDAICLPLLEFLAGEGGAQCALAAVVTQPDRPHGRGRRLRPNPVAGWAQARGIGTLKPEKPGRELADWLAAQDLTLALVMAYGHFLGRRLREAPRAGMLNFHASLLPHYRGASPVETAVASGESETGVCLMRVEAAMDAGAVADCERVAIGPDDSAPVIRRRIAESAVPLLRRNLAAALAGTLEFTGQDPSSATVCRKLRKDDGWIDFGLAAGAIRNRVRGFQPWPGAWFGHNGTRIRVGSASCVAGEAGAEPGTVVALADGVEVACAEGRVRFMELQRPGGRMLPAAEFLRGYPLAAGSRLEGGCAESLVLPLESAKPHPTRDQGPRRSKGQDGV